MQEASTESKRKGCLKFVLLFSRATPNAKLHLCHHPLRNHGPRLKPSLHYSRSTFMQCSPLSLSQPNSPFQFPHGTPYTVSHPTFFPISFCPHSPLPPQAPAAHSSHESPQQVDIHKFVPFLPKNLY